MTKTKVITDSDSSLSLDLATRYGIEVVPITVHFGEEIFNTNVDINDKTLFERIDKTGKLPTTAAPPAFAFSKAYKKAFSEGADSIICICVASKVSATYTSAFNACEDFPGKKITVIDSNAISMGQAFIAIDAVENLKAGKTYEQVVKRAGELYKNLHLYASLSTLKYLSMSGRVGKLTAGMADLLNIRPILTMINGKLDMLEKVRTKRAAMDRLVELTCKSVGDRPIDKMAIVHINNLPDSEELLSRLKERLKVPSEVFTMEFTPGLSVHTGSGLVGANILTK
jgi:DegV family protein with EDD domain